ncbi:immunoglobulin gamma-1 heavy chain-like [Moschus berezovskii]|uniref:immunoglobulin gamma-1 heavy chain-like n=1 Tax=Moschus berezovskii TaxID=68408 RepID=UPI002443DC3A|nr:immunoglobulin gamma-1 heavy chain-like [Moschus berezovskii]
MVGFRGDKVPVVWGEKAAWGSPAHCGDQGSVSTVAWTPALLVLLSHRTGSPSSPVLTQPASLSASPGASARLSCTQSGGYSGGAYAICWYQQKPGSPPWYLLRVKSDSHKNQGSGVPSRFSGSKDASTNAGLLLISGLQPEDEADYYCAVWRGDANVYTALQTSEEVRHYPPPLTPARGSMKSRSGVTSNLSTPQPPPLSTVRAVSAGPTVQFRAQVLRSWEELQSWRCDVSGNQQVPAETPNHDACWSPALRIRDQSLAPDAVTQVP